MNDQVSTEFMAAIKAVIENDSHPHAIAQSIKEGLASNVSISESQLMQLARSPYAPFQEIVSNPNISNKALASLTDDLNASFSIVECEDASSEILKIIAEKWDDSWLMTGIAEHANTPEVVLCKLAENDDEQIRAGVASNANTSPDALVRLAEDESDEVRANVAYNPNTPVEALEILCRDESYDVRNNVAQNPSAPQELIDEVVSRGEDIALDILGSYPLTPELFKKLAEDPNKLAKTSLASNPTFPVSEALKVLEELGYVPSSEDGDCN